MKRLACLVTLVFTACGVPPAWDGTPESCDYIIEGACVRGIERESVEEALVWARDIFGPFEIDGYLIEKVPVVMCGVVRADGCNNGTTYDIQIAEDSPFCFRWVLVHEFGHIAVDDPQHKENVWVELFNKYYYPICDNPFPVPRPRPT